MKFKKSLRDKMIENQKALDHYAILTGKPRTVVDIPEKRETRTRKAPVQTQIPLERDTLKEIVAVLLSDHLVGMVERYNSGVAMNDAGAPVRFHHIYQGKGLRKCDIEATLYGGRILCIEVKRQGWKKPTDDREREQDAYLRRKLSIGALGMFANDPQNIVDALNRIRSGVEWNDPLAFIGG